MKTSVIILKREENFIEIDFSKTLAVLSGGVLDIDTVSVLKEEDFITLGKRIEEAETYDDNLIILMPKGASYSVKKVICEKLSLELSVNENATTVLREKKESEEIIEKESLLPFGATLIPNFIGITQGFMIENTGFTLVALPLEYSELFASTDGYVIPYFKLKTGKKPERWQFKYFGALSELNKNLLCLSEGADGRVKYLIDSHGGDHAVTIIFSSGTEKAKIDELKREIIERLSSGIYADFLTTLSERLFHLLKLRNVKLSVAESFTGGRIVSSLIENSGVSKYLNEGAVTYSNLSKVKRLGVREEDIIKLGAVSSKVCYQMAAGLLKGGECDMAIATTGIAGPESEDTVKPVGLSFIAVGDKNGVHVYKYNFTGSREEITETAKNTALFLAIKKLKNI